jgi:pentatricopeptide repeat domain-containing protein 2
MYHHLGQADAALNAFKDPALEGFFDQLMSYQVLMDLLFINGRFEDLMDVFDIVVQRQTQGARYPKHAVVLAMGALYKMVN